MEAIENGQSPVIFGDGTQTMDFVYVDDVARANLMAARAPVSDAVYNIGSGSEVSLKECAELMLESMGARLPIQYAPARKVNPVPRRLSDPYRAQDELGFQALVSFDEGVDKLVSWWRAQRKAAAFA
jgi:UDP-glucose 4-epimerase